MKININDIMKININDTVKVKLTPHGKKVLEENHNNLWHGWRYKPIQVYQPPKEDVDGWSEWQLWVLMQQLGPHISMLDLCFETEIEIVSKTKKET